MGNIIVRATFDDTSCSISTEDQPLGDTKYMSSYTKEEDERERESDARAKSVDLDDKSCSGGSQIREGSNGKKKTWPKKASNIK